VGLWISAANRAKSTHSVADEMKPIVQKKVFYSKLMFYKAHTCTLPRQTIT